MFACFAALAASSVFAATLRFHTVLSGAREKVPNTTSATGEATVVLDTVTQIASYRIEFSGLSSPTTKVHFHGLKLAGMKAPEVIVEHDRAQSPVAGTIHLNHQQRVELEHGDWYANVHTEKYPAGEIRGWLTRVP
jgi:hypothetical protein